MDGADDAGVLRDGIEQQGFGALPAFPVVECADVFAAKGLLVEDTAVFVADVRIGGRLEFVEREPFLYKHVARVNFGEETVGEFGLGMEPVGDCGIL